MIMNKLKVGQRIDVYEALTDGGYLEDMPVGHWGGSICTGDGLVGVFCNHASPLNMCTGENGTIKEVRKVGTMVIKKVKA